MPDQIVTDVSAPLQKEILEGATEQSYWDRAGTRSEARSLASKSVLYAIQYYKQGQDDVLTEAG
ncbi:hypothetical protein FRC00_000481, partial [Tulasnella sp. 408]